MSTFVGCLMTFTARQGVKVLHGTACSTTFTCVIRVCDLKLHIYMHYSMLHLAPLHVPV
jgi:hypothetical protein